MYIVALEWIAWYDTVLYTTAQWFRAGDLLMHNNIPYIAIGDVISFQDLYPKKEHKIDNFEIIYKSFLSKQTLQIIHWIVKHYFSSYKHVLHLFIPFWLRQKKPPKIVKVSEKIPQICIIYPDFWSLVQHHPINTIKDKTLIIHGTMTKAQKIQAYWKIKQGTVDTIIATNRWLFFDWHNIQKIIINKPSNRSYSNQSDPRFVIQEIAEQYAAMYQASLDFVN